MAWVATAVVGGTLVGGYLSSRGAQSAANTQAGASIQGQQMVLDAGQRAANMDLGAINQANAYLDPYAQMGQNASGSLNNLLTGLGNGNAQAALENMPGYQFQKQQGLEAVQNGFAARGLGSSGAAMKGAANYMNGLTSQNVGNYYNMLLGGSQLGANAATLQAQNTSNLTTAASNAMVGGNTNAASLGMAGAQATAAGQAASANILGNSISNAGNTAGQYLMMNKLMGMYG